MGVPGLNRSLQENLHARPLQHPRSTDPCRAGERRRRRLRVPGRARAFTCPVYMVYPEARDEEAYEPILEGLRSSARRLT